MITNTGKGILAKYLLGHTNSYASHIAIGCGPTPLNSLEDPDFYAESYEKKESLDFEMFRVPITSRGYVNEDDSTYVVFTAELPTTERYAITEVGVYSAGSNPEAGVADSKLLRTFSDIEGWEYHGTTAAQEIPRITSAMDSGDNYIFPLDEETGDETGFEAFRVSSENPTFLYEDRIARQEVPRFLDSSIAVRGDKASIAIDSTDNLIPDDTESFHIHLTGVSLNLDQNSPTDELRFAFSIIDRVGNDPSLEPEENSTNPSEVRIVLDFASAEGGNVQYARMEIRLVDEEDGVSFSENRYFVVSKQLQELTKTVGFTWDQVTTIKAYASVLDDDLNPSDNYYVAYDGLRLENKTDISPLFGLTGYSVIKNNEGYPIIKRQNTSSFVEFRFGFQLNQYELES
jgi:hypothetical protein